MTLPRPLIDRAIEAAFAEDLGLSGDITTDACIPADATSKTVIAARKPGTIAGLDLARAAFEYLSTETNTNFQIEDGARVTKGGVIARIEGPSRAILTAERIALNYLGRLSGIATMTAALVDAVSHTEAQIACTRKTTPGLRAFEKHAVKCGGGKNHRFGLFDAVMIKDNHIIAAGGINAALAAVRTHVGHTVKIEIEIDRLDQLEAALTGGADIILLDNMSTDELREAVRLTKGRARLEASGNVTLETVAGIAETGVDTISSGALTHSAPNLDLGLDFLT
ncbi:MAG: carboxylating nicotinate-nucleotide diphosphorylase [Pseudomonadota bacterium]